MVGEAPLGTSLAGNADGAEVVVTLAEAVVTREGVVVTRAEVVVTREGVVVTREAVATREAAAASRVAAVATREAGRDAAVVGVDVIGMIGFCGFVPLLSFVVLITADE